MFLFLLGAADFELILCCRGEIGGGLAAIPELAACCSMKQDEELWKPRKALHRMECT